MRKVIAAINMTVDGFCDHTAVLADEEIHQHYTDLLDEADFLLYGRVTYQLMEFWPPLVKNPSGEKHMDDFALAIDRVPKIVFSRSLKKLDWHSASLATRGFEEEVKILRQQDGSGSKNIFLGSPSLIVQATRSNLVDEYQLTIHPVIAAKGLPLFKNISDKVNLKLLKTKTFGCGAVTHYYQPVKE